MIARLLGEVAREAPTATAPAPHALRGLREHEGDGRDGVVVVRGELLGHALAQAGAEAVQHGDLERLLRGVVVEEVRLLHVRRGRHLVHAHALQAAGEEELLGFVQDALAAGGIGSRGHTNQLDGHVTPRPPAR
jgi:hypothetical protein